VQDPKLTVAEIQMQENWLVRVFLQSNCKLNCVNDISCLLSKIFGFSNTL